MMHVQISRGWLFSALAQRVYLVCAILDIAFVATRIGVIAAMTVSEVSTLPAGLIGVLKFLFLPEIAGTAILFVGMSYCWLGIEGSYKKKLFWILLFGLFLITMPIYYFVFYRRLAAKDNGEQTTAVLATT